MKYKELVKRCEHCGNVLERKRYNGRLEDFGAFKRRKYCNRNCMSKSFIKIGKNNQIYSNAHTTARKINEEFLNKDKCEICNSTKNILIHHIDFDWQNNNFDNLQCLCKSCHMKIHTSKSLCVICGNPVKGLGYCEKHYLRYKKYGNPYMLYGKVEKENDKISN